MPFFINIGKPQKISLPIVTEMKHLNKDSYFRSS